MKTERVTVRLGETIPTQQFANVRPEVEVTVSGDEPGGELFAAAYDAAKRALKVMKDEALGKAPQADNLNQGGVRPAVKPAQVGIPSVTPPTW